MASTTVDLLRRRAELRERNLNPALQRGAFASRGGTLKSDLKKATALAKRFRNYSAESSEKTILVQLDTVSFGMFLSEAAQGVVQSLCQGTKMKSSDAHSLALVCSEVHQRYEGFWPLVRKELKENAEKLIDMEGLKMAVERIEESAAATVPAGGGGGDGSTTAAVAPAVSSSASTGVAATSGGGGSSNMVSGAAPSVSKSPLEEFNHLRLVARVFGEWWLVGLLEDARPVLNLLKLLCALVEKRAAISSAPLAVATLLSLAILIIREVGIEMLGKRNAALRFFFAEDRGNNGQGRLRDFAGHCGSLTVDGSGDEASNTVFLLGPAGARLTFNAAAKTVGAVDDAVAQQAEEASWARLREAQGLPVEHYSTDEEKRQFATLVLATAKVSITAYEHRKKKAEGWWQTIYEQTELREKTVRQSVEEAQFRLFQEHVERLYVMCDNLLGMLGFVAPAPVDLTITEHKTSVEITLTSVAKKNYAVVEAETLNRFADDEQRMFYEYVPDLQALPEDLLPSLTAEKANWDSLLRRKALSGPVTAAATSGGDVEDGNEDDEAEIMELDTSMEGAKDEKLLNTNSKSGSFSCIAAMMERRRLRMAELGVPAALFDEYAAVLQLLEEFDQCTTADAVDEWCESFFQEALRPLQQLQEHAAPARLFFTNCRVLLTLELWHYPWVHRPEMLPRIARCAAIMFQYFPDSGDFLSGNLESQWRQECKVNRAAAPTASLSTGLGGATSQRRVSAILYYMCELMKFGIIPPNRLLGVLKTAAEDLTHHCSTAAISAVLEHGGLYLLRSHPTKRMTEKVIEKLKAAGKHAELEEPALVPLQRALTLLKQQQEHEGPSPTCRLTSVERTPLERYVQYLLCSVLCPATYESVRAQFLKMPWNDAESSEMLVNTLREVHHVSWDTVPLVADLLADLVRADHAWAVRRIVDNVAEDMRRDFEVCGDATDGMMTGELLHRPDAAASLGAAYRPQQWRIVDCVFVANLFRARVVPFRFVGYIVMLLLYYNPRAVPLKNNCTHLRCCVILLSETVQFLPWQIAAREKSRSSTGGHGVRSMERLEGLYQVVRKIMAAIFVHMFSLAQPLPLELRHRLEELVRRIDEYMRRNFVKDEAEKESRARPKEYKSPSSSQQQLQKVEDQEETANAVEGAAEASGMRVPETAEEAQAFAKAVAKETVLPSSAWVDSVREAVLASCRDDALLCRIFLARAPEEPLAITVAEAEAGGEDAVQAPLELLRDESVNGPFSEMTDSNPGCGSVDQNSISVSDSDDEDSSSIDSDGSGDTSDSESRSGASTPGALSVPVSEVTHEGEEEEEEEEEEYEEEEDIGESEEDEDQVDDDGEDEDDDEDDKFAAAEALRRRLEEAELDAKLCALMADNPREAVSRAAPATAKSGGAERLLEQELAMGMRLHRQKQRLRTQQDTSPSVAQEQNASEGEEMRFVVLQRSAHSAPLAGSGGNANTAAAAAAPSNSSSCGGSTAVLCIPRTANFAKSALVLQEEQRQQQEELREITRRINRRQEEESFDDKKRVRTLK
ncbi:ARM repeat-containing protein [Trypanosoma grayi]|uniref:ARM repeat-containing protein n=1 Tax=Trypanosoma grayi TaxID=71804 RepID=UPI0004F46095|nr:ARM repeat-containing protein [Trypanosoma grayi]KEG13187.1 ARM repeat-containing protein [Trypanosoma grayi]